ncbi:MAG: DinB family protein [Bryobacteraceae bacterium]
MPIADMLISELEREAKTTRRVLERVPDDKLTWKPHVKSMTLGRLALHVATIPGSISGMARLDSYDVANFSEPPAVESTAAILAAFDRSVAQAKADLAATDDAAMMKDWSFNMGGNPIMTVPRIGVYRSILLNHLYHHRGQLTVYLRLLDVPVPSIYGPSADENPFA